MTKLVKSIQNNNHKKKIYKHRLAAVIGRDDDVGGWEIAVKLLVTVCLGPVQTPNFSWAESNSNQGWHKLFEPAELIQTLILIAAELSSRGEKCSFQSNCLQNTL